MILKKMLKKIVCSSLVILQIITFMPSQAVFAAQDDIYEQSDKILSFADEEDLKAKVIQDPEFVKSLASLAHYMGFGWCGGTGSQYVGEDFDFKRVGEGRYTLKAHYDPNDPYSEGYWSDKRLEMEISNVKLYMDGDTLEFGESKITDIKPLKTINSKAKNRSDYEDTKTVEFSVQTTDSWSKADNYNFQEHIGIKNKYSFDCKLFGSESEISLDFTADQGWTETNGNSTTLVQKVNYDATLPPQSKRTIQLVAMEKESELPYTVNMYMEYDVTFKGFLRWGGNARNDHPKDRPFVTVKFGGGQNNLSAAEDILDKYIHRDINGYSDWDWDWMINEYGSDKVRNALSNICKKSYGGIVTGKFIGVGGTYFDIDAGPVEPLDDSDTSTRTKRSLNSNGITVEDVEVYDVPGIKLIEINVIGD